MGPRKLIVIAAMAAVGLGLPAVALAIGLRGAAHPATATGRRTSQPTTGRPEVGALFATAARADHDCTATVIDSPHGDVLLTAAHCVSGSGAGTVFAPGFHHGISPAGRWTVTAAYLAVDWRTSQTPEDDFAFLTVASRTIHNRRREIEQVTGADRLATPHSGEQITVLGYPMGSDNDPITCQARVYFTEVFPTFDCSGYVAGTSGGPWLISTASGPRIVGLIGGRNQGGCVDSTSYSPLLTKDATAAYARASDHAAPDVAPVRGTDGCESAAPLPGRRTQATNALPASSITTP